MQHTDEEIL